MNRVIKKCMKIESAIKVNYLEHTDKPKIEQGKAKGINNYIEIEHAERVEQVQDCFAVIDNVKIQRGHDFTCPVKTFAIFASNEEFSFLPDELPERVR